jgi:tRNA pseudouridine38-40 synthase
VFAYRLAYDGRSFHGFQRQPEVPTVEDSLRRALQDLEVIEPAAELPDSYSAAGRTDAGVSALAQTITLDAPSWLTPSALNGGLPDRVQAWARAPVPGAFHATHDASSRRYVYYLHAPGADLERAREAAARLSGPQDFHNLTPATAGTERDLSVTVTPHGGDLLVLEATADGFVHELVRRITRLIEAVATGAADLDRVDHLLGAEPVDGPDGVAPAAPEPLVLVDVTYPDVTFSVDPDAGHAVAERFRERAGADRAAAAALARIGDGIGDHLESGTAPAAGFDTP